MVGVSSWLPGGALRWLAWFAAVVMVSGGIARASEQQPARQLIAAGNEEILWLVLGEENPEEKRTIQWSAYQGRSSERIVSARKVGPQVGRIRRATVVGDGLHVFFGPGPELGYGAHMRYTPEGVRREKKLPDRAPPEAVAGQVVDRRRELVAVVSGTTADAVEAAWLEARPQAASQPVSETSPAPRATSAPERAGQPAGRPSTSFYLVRYRNFGWEPWIATPGACMASHRFWLDLAGESCHLLWQREAGEREIHHAWYENGSWSVGPAARLSGVPKSVYFGEMNRQRVLAVLMETEDAPDRWRCETLIWRPPGSDGTPAAWGSSNLLLEDKDTPLSMAAQAAVGAIGDNLVIHRFRAGGSEVGLWSPGGGVPTGPFKPVDFRRNRPDPSERNRVRDLAATLIVAAVLLLVVWRRRESIAMPTALPAGLMTTGVGKRAMAALIDVIPAGAVVLAIWHDPILPYLGALWEASQAGDTDAMEDLVLEVPSGLIWGWATFRVLYVLYCGFSEMSGSATPGKRLLGCRVLSETAGEPNAVQIVIRNLTRFLELEPLLHIWPFLLLVLLTRKRQRLGDLLARTIVVEGEVDVSAVSDGKPPDESGA